MKLLEALVALAREARLYPSLILYGGSEAERIATAETLARTLLCDAAVGERPCGRCRHCRRIVLAPTGDAAAPFHPDVRALSRDLKAFTSVEAAKGLAAVARQTPFESRGQVFVLLEADTLTGEAANALLKVIEEPAVSAPRHFLLLAPSRQDLLPTLRSRSWSLFLGTGAHLDDGAVAPLVDPLVRCLRAARGAGAPLALLQGARLLAGVGGFEDPQAEAPWALGAAALARAARELDDVELRRGALALAAALLEDAPLWRLRSVPAERLLEGLFSRHLASLAPGRVAAPARSR